MADNKKTKEDELAEVLAAKPIFDDSAERAARDEALSKLQNREKFSFDVNADALYNQYKDAYQRNGNLAMRDSVGKASALTGGYGNSYAQTVGQQTYNQYMQGLNDRVPELYQLALDRYNAEGDVLRNDLAIAQGELDDKYSRFNDDYKRWADMRDFTYQDATDSYKDTIKQLQDLLEVDEDGNITGVKSESAIENNNIFNKIAPSSLQFVRTKNNGETLFKWTTEDGKSKKGTFSDLANYLAGTGEYTNSQIEQYINYVKNNRGW